MLKRIGNFFTKICLCCKDFCVKYARVVAHYVKSFFQKASKHVFWMVIMLVSFITGVLLLALPASLIIDYIYITLGLVIVVLGFIKLAKFKDGRISNYYEGTLNIVLGILVPLLLALLINEIGKKWFAKIVQTTFFLPFFLSWIILGGIINQMFSYDGIMNSIVSFFGGNKVLFLLDNNIFRQIIIWSDVWKGMGYNMVIFLAAILGIDPNLYEAAKVDGASRLRQIWHITLPGIVPVVVLVSTLSLGGLLNGNFDQVYVLYNPMVYESADIIDTFIYRLGFEGNPQIDVATAVGLLKSIISVVLVGGTYYIAYKKFDYRIF